MHKNRKCVFSLAEAMITILIIGILALLSVPVAKKIVKKDSNPNKGIWMATRNSNGEAVYWKKGMGNKDNPDKWTKCNTTCEINGQTVSDCCVFDSPLNVRNFSLTVVGGGGGGGGAGRRQTCHKGNDGAAGSQGEVVFGSSAVNKKNYNSSEGNGVTRCGSMYCPAYDKKACNGQGCYGKVSRGGITEMENLFDVSLLPFSGSVNKYGDGGETWSTHLGGILVGANGYAAMMVDVVYVGEGGKAAPNPKISKFYPSFDKRRFDVTIDAGGKGGEKGMAGKPGGETKVGNIFTVQGGDGGESYNPTTTSTTGKYAGGNGGDDSMYIKGEVQTTAKGGYASGNTSSANGQNAKYYGSGGGGAGVSGSTSGTGGNGAPGYVIIEW